MLHALQIVLSIFDLLSKKNTQMPLNHDAFTGVEKLRY